MAKNIMSGAEFCKIRRDLKYSQAALGELWNMGRWGGRTVRRWESGTTPIPGPVAFAIRAMQAGYSPDPQEVQIHG